MKHDAELPTHGPPCLAPRALIVDGAGRTLLLQRSADSRHWPGQWDLPGGKPEQGEDWTAALQREVFEETGLRVRLTGLVGAAEHDLVIEPADGEPGMIRRLIVLVLRCVLDEGAGDGSGDEVVRLSDEHQAFVWVDADRMPGMEIVEPQRRAMGLA